MASMQLTGGGWENGYGAMACDDASYDGVLGIDSGFVVAQRMEVTRAGSIARGISAVFGGEPVEGELIRAILFDAQLAFIDTSLRHALTPEDLTTIAAGDPLFLPLSTTPSLEPGDYFVGMQRLDGPGGLRIATGGNGPIGATVILSGITFVVDYARQTPMVRLHVADFGVGLVETAVRSELQLQAFPIPMDQQTTLAFMLQQAGPVSMEIRDLTGRLLMQEAWGVLPAGPQARALEVGHLPAGAHILSLINGADRSSLKIIVLHR
jgi:hypothetical protein